MSQCLDFHKCYASFTLKIYVSIYLRLHLVNISSELPVSRQQVKNLWLNLTSSFCSQGEQSTWERHFLSARQRLAELGWSSGAVWAQRCTRGTACFLCRRPRVFLSIDFYAEETWYLQKLWLKSLTNLQLLNMQVSIGLFVFSKSCFYMDSHGISFADLFLWIPSDWLKGFPLLVGTFSEGTQVCHHFPGMTVHKGKEGTSGFIARKVLGSESLNSDCTTWSIWTCSPVKFHTGTSHGSLELLVNNWSND